MAVSNYYIGRNSSSKAKYIHSININEYNTWDDWHLIPSTRPLVNPPAKKQNIYEPVGINGILDESDTLRNFAVYSTRKGSWKFYVENDHGYWQSRYSQIMSAIHGKHCQITLDDDPSWYYAGTVLVNEWQSNKDRSMIVLDYELYPYKLSYTSSLDSDWLWDPFNFDTDIIYSKPGFGMNRVNINSSYSWFKMVYSDKYFGDQPISPIIKISNSANGFRIKLDNPELKISNEDFYEIEGGQRIDGVLVPNTSGIKIANFTLSTINEHNQNTIWLKGSGDISFDFRVGRF